MIKNAYTALVTPFNNGKVCFDTFKKLIDFQINQGINGILLLGTTGESPALNEEEKKKIIEVGINHINKRVKVMVGTGTNNFEKTVENTLFATKMGADSVLVITPYYNKSTQNGLYEYFKQVHNATQVPICIYNVPGRTGINISAQTTIKLANDFDRIVAIKDATGDIVQASEIINNTSNNFTLLSGEDAINYPLLAIGASGVISVTSNILPNLVAKMCKLVAENNFTEAKKLHYKLLDINQKLFIETNPIPVKHALYELGLCSAELRLPLYKISTQNLEILKQSLKEFK